MELSEIVKSINSMDPEKDLAGINFTLQLFSPTSGDSRSIRDVDLTGYVPDVKYLQDIFEVSFAFDRDCDIYRMALECLDEYRKRCNEVDVILSQDETIQVDIPQFILSIVPSEYADVCWLMCTEPMTWTTSLVEPNSPAIKLTVLFQAQNLRTIDEPQDIAAIEAEVLREEEAEQRLRDQILEDYEKRVMERQAYNDDDSIIR